MHPSYSPRLAEQIRQHLGENYPLDDRLRQLLDHVDASYRALPTSSVSASATADAPAEGNFWSQELFFRQVLDTNPSPIFVRDEAGRFLFANQALADLLGKSKKEITNPQKESLPARPEENQYSLVDRQVIRQKAIIALEESFTRPDGEVRWFYTIKKPLYLSDGTVHVLGISTDITEGKRTAAQLAANELRYRQLVECATDLISHCDPLGFFAYANPVTCRVLGYPEEELRNRHYLEFVAPEDRPLLEKFYTRQFKRRIPDTYLEFKAITGEGKSIWVGQSVHLLTEGKLVTGFHAVARNITKRKEVEAELIGARQLAEDSVKAKEHFLSVMSHEIRTPLNTVIGLSHLLLEENPLPGQIEKLQAIKFSADNLMVISNDILDFSKIESGKIDFERIAFDLPELFRDIEQSFGYKAKASNLRLLFELDANLPKFLAGDPVRLNQILLNLVGNALKFTEKGFIEVKATEVERTRETVTIEFKVTDTGIGIPDDKLETIFDSFTQASPETTRKYGGTGLGLAITRRIIELQGGRISVKSKVGLGSVFSFRLTFETAPQPKLPYHLPESAAPALQDLQDTRILLVEDNKMNQLVICKFLQKWGVQIEIAENGLEAIDKLQHNTYEVILMDLQMPQMDGYKAAQYIRTNLEGATRTIPIVALTASALLDVKRKVLEAGMNDFITKPFDPRELHLKILKYTGKVQRTPEAAEAPKTNGYVNLGYLEEISANNQEFIRDMIKLFIRQTPQFLDQLKDACQVANWADIRYTVHKMKSTLATVGITELEPVMHQLETLAVQESPLAGVMQLVSHVEEICAKACDELQQKLTAITEEDGRREKDKL